LGEQYSSLRSSLCSFLHSPVTSSLLGPNMTCLTDLYFEIEKLSCDTRKDLLDINEASVRGQFVITGYVKVITFVWGSLNLINLQGNMQAECFKLSTYAPPISARVWNCSVRFLSES
jgi:hypothetical protein